MLLLLPLLLPQPPTPSSGNDTAPIIPGVGIVPGGNGNGQWSLFSKLVRAAKTEYFALHSANDEIEGEPERRNEAKSYGAAFCD